MRTHERGFTLLEALVSIALTTIAIFGVCAAVLGSLQATNAALAKQALTDDALNVLSDLRTATAYDAAQLATLVGERTTGTIVRDGTTLHVAISITQARTSAPIVAHVTVTDPSGIQSSEQQQLYHEAPAPGSVIEQGAPLPASALPPQNPSPGSGAKPHGGAYGR